MAVCPFATWHPITGSSGAYTSGPFKIVHHTTEGSSANGAFDAFQANRSDPHFTVDDRTIYQHIDTSIAARALRNARGGVQTNRDGALQIEVVGFAHLPKNGRTLRNVARLCRWLEGEHSVPQIWPNGLPKTATPAGRDPGGHNRNRENWEIKGGHYGHCHVPENTHWDPGYTGLEVELLMSASFDLGGAIRDLETLSTYRQILENDVDIGDAVSTMPDHAERAEDDEEF